MEREAFRIENGVIRRRESPVFESLYLSVCEKETVGLICDSTVEKKCLLQFFKGELTLKEGRAYADGQRKSLKEMERYLRENVAVIEKTGKLISTLGVWENVCLFADKRKLLFSAKYGKEAHRLTEEFGISAGAGDEVKRLSEKDRVLMELLKAYVEDKKTVVLADLTGFLRKNELEEVRRLTVRMRERGMAFLILEPFEDIVFEWSRRIAVIRHGRTVEMLESEHVDRHKLYEALMRSKSAGGPSPESFSETELSCGATQEVLSFRGVETDYLKDVSFGLEKGMALKIFLLDDESGEQIVELLCGTKKLRRGDILLDGKSYRARSYTQAMKKGICFLPESPYERMLIYDMTVKDNISLALSRKSPLIWMKRSLKKSLEKTVNDWFDEEIANVKLRRLPPDTLQKVAYFKWILYRPRVAVCVKPFAEMDIHIQEITARMIAAYQEQGIAVILLTSNFSELGRIEGETVYIRKGRRIDEDQVYQILYGNQG